MPVSPRGGGGGVNAFQQQGKQTWGQDETELMFPEVSVKPQRLIPVSRNMEANLY